MKKIQNIYKPIGLTPYQAIQAFRKKSSKFKGVKIGFAGRLDPLAHGVMLLMIGNATKDRNKYLGLPKVYEFQILFGVETDTYDALGILQNRRFKRCPEDLEDKIKQFIKSKLGKQTIPYPPYSSIEVNGKPLYQWAREDKLSEIEIPKREFEIYDFDLLEIKDVSKQKIKKTIYKNINSVTGDFRQNKILKKWAEFFERNSIETFKTATCRIHCSSGTYVRSLAHKLGMELGCGAIALDILRTKVGIYTVRGSIKLKV